jgi:formate hydrogenlyase subunit 3/multisubunit Na+/H+ antiporter MnhD subunit
MAEPTLEARRGRSALASLALAVAAISAVGIVIILIGIALDIEGAEEGEETGGWRVLFEIAWLSFFFGAIASLILGLIAFFTGRRRAEPDTTRAGSIALGWFAIAVVIFIVAGVLTS